MKLSKIYANQKENENIFFSRKMPVISFEVFPPKIGNIKEKTDELFKEFNILKQFDPALISVTYGAGGTTAENSIEITKRVKTELELTPMPHLTCILKDENYIENYLSTIQKMGVENILALRGDLPKDMQDTGSRFKYANELVEFIKSKTDLSIGVAGYPEKHCDAPSLEVDIENLKRKVDAGADAIYTQLFFDNTRFHSYVQLVRDSGIEIPIVAGILPITSYQQLERMTGLCNASIPKVLLEKIEKHKDSPDDVKEIGIDFATYQCLQLIDTEVKGLHFYCLNKSQPVATILENIL